MDHNKTNSAETPPAAVLPIVRIDGARIKKIRDEKGLTQLYLSEVVGVTTDTISRWENRRYPSIKLENAQKLAHALEVELDDILEKEQNAPPEKNLEQPPDRQEILPTRFPAKLYLIVLLTVTLAGFAYWYFLPPKIADTAVAATRILPPHIPPGQIFPVIIRVQNPDDATIALIIKETVPAGMAVVTEVPSFTTFDPKNNELKWISRTGNNQTIFAYSAKAPDAAATNQQLEFHGSVTLKQASPNYEEILGNSILAVLPYHWADTDKDLMIDDEEILAVYDLYSDIQGLGFDRDLIDEIWAGGGYRWDEKTGKYIVPD